MTSDVADELPPPERSTGKDPDYFADEAKRILRSAMERHGYSFKDLAGALDASAEGPTESVQALINKVNRGRFSFAFLVRACRAMGATSVDVAELPAMRRAGPLPRSRSTRSGASG